MWIIVKSQARKAEVKQTAEGHCVVSVRAPAREGKANQALVELLASHFHVPKSSVRIIHGQTGKRKLVQID
ncbi:MAG: DUF167 domain-containing protein [Candidatus Binatia bacterium]